MAKKVKWQLDSANVTEPLATCGKWKAELGCDELYSEGLVFILYAVNEAVNEKVPEFFGKEQSIPEPEEAMTLITQVSERMVKNLICSQPCRCRCQNVYVVSLNEGDFEKVQKNEKAAPGLHFRLLPRYQHDEGFLKRIDKDGDENDGLALMAEWRKQFLLRDKTGKWGDFPRPRKKYPCEWTRYAEYIRAKLKRAVEESSKKCC
jgi:hypothetical protein